MTSVNSNENTGYYAVHFSVYPGSPFGSRLIMPADLISLTENDSSAFTQSIMKSGTITRLAPDGFSCTHSWTLSEPGVLLVLQVGEMVITLYTAMGQTPVLTT